ncbi:MAG: hypothetical protein IK137_01720 [Bacilli bacterium]|nr:hypothetical protein [Bacilli bacterium]
MIIIYKDLIKKYINLLEPIHIKNYASNKNIFITNQEVNIIHNFIKTYYNELLEDESILNELKPLIREDLYKEVLKEYKENKVKYF